MAARGEEHDDTCYFDSKDRGKAVASIKIIQNCVQHNVNSLSKIYIVIWCKNKLLFIDDCCSIAHKIKYNFIFLELSSSSSNSRVREEFVSSTLPLEYFSIVCVRLRIVKNILQSTCRCYFTQCVVAEIWKLSLCTRTHELRSQCSVFRYAERSGFNYRIQRQRLCYFFIAKYIVYLPLRLI